jgi:hypothetical protein
MQWRYGLFPKRYVVSASRWNRRHCALILTLPAPLRAGFVITRSIVLETLTLHMLTHDFLLWFLRYQRKSRSAFRARPASVYCFTLPLSLCNSKNKPASLLPKEEADQKHKEMIHCNTNLVHRDNPKIPILKNHVNIYQSPRSG